jgi:hypothetical protein
MVNHIQKHDSSRADRITSPERELWIAVLGRALLDAFKEPPHLNLSLRMNATYGMYYKYNRDQARHFFLAGGDYFTEVCEMAGRNATYVKEKVRKLILRANGWNVDVPINFPTKYRSRRRSPREKKQKGLTGNSYYAAKKTKR